MKYVHALFAMTATVSLTAQAETFVEAFDDRPIEGGWTFGTGSDTLETTGGNPGGYLHESYLDTFAPQASTSPTGDSRFQGDYRARGVTSVGIDLQLFRKDYPNSAGQLSVVLRSDNQTPDDYTDDYGAYYVGERAYPQPGQGWVGYAFEISSTSKTLPPGWSWMLMGENSPAVPDWNTLITGVDQLTFFFGDPSLYYIFQTWDVGMDNASITYGDATEACPADLNDSGAVDQRDMALLLKNMGGSGTGDLNGDGVVDKKDVVIMRGSYGTCPQ